MSWNPLAEPIDYVLIAGRRTPGLAEVVNASSPREWDERRAYGTIGARLVYRGSGLARFSIRLRFTTDAEWEEWSDFAPLVARIPDTQRPTALDVWHPALEDLGITALVIAEVMQPVREGDDGAWMVELKCIEHRPPYRRVVPIDGSRAEPEPPPDAGDQMINHVLRVLAAEEAADAARARST